MRIGYINRIVSTHPNWKKFKAGWLNRINSIIYEDNK
jgi:hypothetical protein